jgi:translation initiation factor IF-2
MTTVSQLAALLGKKPFQIIADLMEIGVFASANQSLDFEAISKVARQYGFIAKKA